MVDKAPHLPTDRHSGLQRVSIRPGQPQTVSPNAGTCQVGGGRVTEPPGAVGVPEASPGGLRHPRAVSGESRRLDLDLEVGVSGRAQQPVTAAGHDCLFDGLPAQGPGPPEGLHARAALQPGDDGRDPQPPASAQR